MSYREPNFGWDLPPGVSQRDIDEAFGSPDPEDAYEHEPDDDPYCQECLEKLRFCECSYTTLPELPDPEEEGDYDEEPF